MSLVPYREDSVILDDPNSKSLVILNPSVGSLKVYQQIYNSNNKRRSKNNRHDDQLPNGSSIASFVCPGCGTEIDPTIAIENLANDSLNENNDSASATGRNKKRNRSISSNSLHVSQFNLSKKYFKLLENSHRRLALEDIPTQDMIGFNVEAGCYIDDNTFFIPADLFTPGYFHKFFKTLELLGRGARGSVFKVVHQMGNIELGVFALKKIPIGNDIVWFEKCIREVKALSSITHESPNLITYNHVWLEMDTACGLVRMIDGNSSDTVEKIPCIFILQQYCDGGNLEDVILRDVFKKFPELGSIEERKMLFKLNKDRKANGGQLKGMCTVQIISIIKNIANGLQELHGIGLIHRDLKPSNCLLLHKFSNDYSTTLNENYISFPTVVIGDLGECQISGECRSGTGATGTLEFTAPEVIITGTLSENNSPAQDYNEYTYASDMYSLGMILYFIIFGGLPFESDLEIIELKDKIKHTQFSRENLIFKHQSMNLNEINHELFDIMINLLNIEPAARATASEVSTLLEELSSKHSPPDIFKKDTTSVVFGNTPTEILDEDISLCPKQKLTISYKIKPTNRSLTYISSSRTQKSLLVFRTLCFITDMLLSLFVVVYSPPGSISSHLAILTLGVGFKTPTKSHHYILIVLTLIALNTFLSDYFHLLMSII